MTLRMSFAAIVALFFFSIADAEEPDKGPAEFKNLKYRNIGPSIGGRVARACGVPGDPFTYYAATSAGGVWKSSDGGFSWKSIFDDQPIASIGSIAVAPSDPNVIFVGSGEANIRGNVAPGNGIYKSTDAGKTWNHVWKAVGQIGTMAIHPTNPDIAFAAVLGDPFGASRERGVYRTRNGGKTWERVLFKDEDTGASDVCFDASNPRILFAGMWQARRRPWELTSGGPGSGLYTSRDGGDTWKKLEAIEPPAPGKPKAQQDEKEAGLPKAPWGKVCVAVAPTNGQRVFAMIEAEEGGLYRSDDGGEKWSRVNDARAIRQRAWYFSVFTVDPTNADNVWFPQVPLLKSTDGGKTLQRVSGPHHGDHHDIWIDPKNPHRIIDCNDGGVDISVNGGQTWFAPQLPIAQFYHVACDASVPYRVGGCVQDIGAYAGPSNSLTKGILLSDWEAIGGGEAGHTVFDPTDSNVVYASEYGGYISRFDRRTRQARHIGAYPYDPSGIAGEELKYRFQWTAPIAMSPFAPHAIYHGANVLFRSKDGGQTWDTISGDLTRNDKNKQKWSGGPITGDNTGVETYCTIFAIAESPKQKGVIWTGSDDGLVHVSRDDGKTWVNVTANIANFPDWGTVCCIEPSPFDAGTAYVTVRAYRMGDFRPYLWRTTDFGKSWVSLSEGIPADEYLHAVRCDPKKKGLLYIGTEKGIRYSYDDGKNWKSLRMNLPTVAVHDLQVKNDDLVVATMGRSIWIFDDLTPVREWTPAVAAKKAHLFAPVPEPRWRQYQSPAADFSHSAGENPPVGITMTYFLSAKPKSATLEILDKDGKTVTKWDNKKEERKDETADMGAYDAGAEPRKKPLPTDFGMNRLTWDMKYDGAKKLAGAVVDSGDAEEGPLALPGEYSIKLTVDGTTATATIKLLPDPRLLSQPFAKAEFTLVPDGKGADELKKLLGGVKPLQFHIAGESGISARSLEEQHQFAMGVRDDVTTLTTTVTQLRTVKKQLGERSELLKDEKSAKELIDANKKLVAKLNALEEKLHNPKAKTVYDILAQKGGAKLYSQYTSLYSYVLDSDGAPTQGMKTVYAEISVELKKLTAEWTALKDGDVAKYNELSKKLDLPGIFVPKNLTKN